MPALITDPIPEQNFEKVRDAIGVILLTELTNQKNLQSLPEDVVIYNERISPMETEENLYFNVLLDSASYGNYTTRDAQGRTIYFIDTYTTGKNKTASNTPGGVDSSKRLHKYIGMAMFILASNQYKTLGLPLGLIGGTYIESFATSEPTPQETGMYQRIGRISLAVRIQENYSLWKAVNLLGNDTGVTLEETDKGYVYKFDTTQP